MIQNIITNGTPLEKTFFPQNYIHKQSSDINYMFNSSTSLKTNA